MNADVLILAAGRGSRLATLTDEKPKTLVHFAGRPILDWQLDALRQAKFNSIFIATGYKSELLDAYGLPTIHNPRWSETNMVSTLLCAQELLHSENDLIVSYSDIVFEPKVIETLSAAEGDIATVIDLNWLDLWKIRSDDPLADAETLLLDGAGRITEIGRKPSTLEEVQGQYIGLTRFTAQGKQAVLNLAAKSETDAWPYSKPLERIHFTDLLRGLIAGGDDVWSAPIRGGWLEIDTPADVAAYESKLREGSLQPFYRLVGEARL